MTQFHDYQSLFMNLKKRNRVPKGMAPATALRQMNARLVKDQVHRISPRHATFGQLSLYEQLWYGYRCPFYNVWPTILDMVLDVKLDIPATSIHYPCPVLVLRMPRTFGRTHTILASCMFKKDWEGIEWMDTDRDILGRICVFSQRVENDAKRTCHNAKVIFDIREGITIEEAMDATKREPSHLETCSEEELDEQIKIGLRIVCGVSILANDPEHVTPVILRKDRDKYPHVDEATRQRMVERAINRQGLGFDIGKELEERLAREVGPHLRRPHFSIRWMKRTPDAPKGSELVPRLRPVKGSVVNRHKFTEVPTGFLGEK